METELSGEEVQKIAEIMDKEDAERKEREMMEGYPIPQQEIKHSVHTFLNKVLEAPDSTKVGNLDVAELGMPKLPVRTHKDLSLFSDKVMQNEFFSGYFKAEAENTLATSLSKGAKLINLAVIQKRIIADESKPKTINKSWFKKKEPTEQEEM